MLSGLNMPFFSSYWHAKDGQKNTINNVNKHKKASAIRMGNSIDHAKNQFHPTITI